MTAIDITSRLTQDRERFQYALKSDDSLVLILPPPIIDTTEPGSCDFTIGDTVYDTHAHERIEIPSQGLELRPQQAVVVETLQKLHTPYNIIGMLSGKGSLIFQGLFVSQGKIDPGFTGKLKVGLLNGGKSKFILKTGDPLCSCIFFRLDTHIDAPDPKYLSEPPKQVKISMAQRVKQLGFDHWVKIIGLIVASIAAYFAYLKIGVK